MLLARGANMKRRQFVAAGTSAAVLTACGGGGSGGSGDVGTTPQAQNRFAQENLAASRASYKAKIVLPDTVGAWGLAIRPAGAGGHFWLGASGGSWEFVGDVKNSPNPALRTIYQDGLKLINPNVGAPSPVDASRVGATTGVAYCGAQLWSGSVASTNFCVGPTSPVATGLGVAQFMKTAGVDVPIEGSARFVFVSDTGVLSAWSERRADDGAVLRVNGNAQAMYDGGTADGSAYFGVAVKPGTWDKIWVADFGSAPQIRQFAANWTLEPTVGFENPFATGGVNTPLPGDFVPFNIQALGNRVFVSYAKSRVSDTDVNAFFAGEEDSIEPDVEKALNFQPDRGRLVEYDTNGTLVRIYKDEKHLNAPWGVAIAPAGFGAFAGAVLVANFGGAGYITAFDATSGAFIGYLRNTDGGFVEVLGIWSLQFGNGNSLGDSDALYFGAGPEGAEPSGLFGSLRYAPK